MPPDQHNYLLEFEGTVLLPLLLPLMVAMGHNCDGFLAGYDAPRLRGFIKSFAYLIQKLPTFLASPSLEDEVKEALREELRHARLKIEAIEELLKHRHVR